MAVKKFPFGAKDFTVAKLVRLMDHELGAQEEHVKLWYISTFLPTWVHEIVCDAVGYRQVSADWGQKQ